MNKILECLDAISKHRDTIDSLAGLLAMCHHEDGHQRQERAVREAGNMILEEVEAIEQWTLRLGETLHRRSQGKKALKKQGKQGGRHGSADR